MHVFVSQLSFKPDVICFSESRKNQPLKNIEIDDYNFTNVKAESQAGGVAVYVSNVLNCLQIESFHLHGAESLWLKISRRKNNEYVVLGTVYRHASEDAKKFINDFSHCLEKLAYENKTFYILGDFNINVNEAANRSLFADSYLQALSSNGAHQIVTKPTRVTDRSFTVIDHIITNDITHTITPRIILSSITDHYPIACRMSKFQASRKNISIPMYRDKKIFCPEAFSDKLNERLHSLISFNFSLSNDNLDHKFDNFVEVISHTIESHAPLKRMSRKQLKLAKKPWITKRILTSIRKKNSMFQSHFIRGSDAEKNYFRRYTNKLTKILFDMSYRQILAMSLHPL